MRAPAMSTEDDTTGAARAAALLRRSPEGAGDGGRGRTLLRRAALRAMRPFTFHQREFDEAVVDALARQEQELRGGRRRLDERVERLEEIARELIATAESLRREARDAGEVGADATSRIELVRSELDAIPFMEGEPFGPVQAPVGDAYGYRDRGALVDAESGYVAFENLFRGSPERVIESQRAYPPLLEGHEPVLEIGCGRGELLAQLRELGIAATGVDTDRGMVAHCRARGLDVVEADGVAHLQSLSDASLGAIFSAQVVEHIPYAELVRLLALAVVKLAPGGLFVAETVNPHKIASLKTFWVDPTHQHPLFPEVALALCAIAGFSSAYVFAPGFESFERSRFEAPAYAVVASAPDESPPPPPEAPA
jgi:SAM-dependent methyltransferase